MPTVDWPLERLQEYRPTPTPPPDFDAFWQAALDELSRTPIEGELERLDYPCDHAEVYDLRFRSAGGQWVAAWYIVPGAALRGACPVPAIAQYHGYTGSRGRVSDHLHWVLQGYAVLAMDCRGQSGDTNDVSRPEGGQAVGRMTQGILDPGHYYFRGVYQDAVRAVQWLRTRPEVDGTRIAASGGSQGGGLALAVAALDGELAATAPDVPFLCHFGRSLEAHSDGPYREIIEFGKRRPELIEESLLTLAYFDGLNMATKIACPVLMSVALLDTICPPSTGFAVYNTLQSPKEMRVYPFNGHEGGGSYHTEVKFRFLRKVFSA